MPNVATNGQRFTSQLSDTIYARSVDIAIGFKMKAKKEIEMDNGSVKEEDK